MSTSDKPKWNIISTSDKPKWNIIINKRTTALAKLYLSSETHSSRGLCSFICLANNKIWGYLISRDISHFITRFSLYCSSIVWQATTKDKMKNLSWKVEWKLQAICLWNVTTFFQTLMTEGTLKSKWSTLFFLRNFIPRACSLEKNKYLTSLTFGVAQPYKRKENSFL